MIQIDLQSRVPIYDQLIRGIVRLIHIGVLETDAQLPSVRSLAVDLGINPNTVQKAYQLLEAQGIIYSIAGRGSFVAPEAKNTQSILKDASVRVREAVQDAAGLGMEKEAVMELVENTYKNMDGGKPA